MANPIETSAEIAKVGMGAMRLGGRFAADIGAGAIQRLQREAVPQSTLDRQEVFRRFPGRIGVVNLLDPKMPQKLLEKRAESAVRTLADQQMLDEGTTVEVRAISDTDSLRDPAQNERRKKVIDLVGNIMDDFGIKSVIPTSHPITPAEHSDTQVAPSTTWNTVAEEFDGLVHQVDPMKTGRSRLTMLGVSDTHHIDQFFGKQIAPKAGAYASPLLVMRQVGEAPQDHMLVPVGQAV